MGGQTLNDRILAARHSLAGQGLAKAVCKATTEELIGPKKKHLDCKYHCILFVFCLRRPMPNLQYNIELYYDTNLYIIIITLSVMMNY